MRRRPNDVLNALYSDLERLKDKHDKLVTAKELETSRQQVSEPLLDACSLSVPDTARSRAMGACHARAAPLLLTTFVVVLL